MKRRSALLALLLIAIAPLAAGDAGVPRNPISVEGQVKDIARDGDFMILHLERSRYTIRALAVSKVKTPDGARMYALDLLKGDSVHIDGDVEGDTIHTDKIRLLLRIEHR